MQRTQPAAMRPVPPAMALQRVSARIAGVAARRRIFGATRRRRTGRAFKGAKPLRASAARRSLMVVIRARGCLPRDVAFWREEYHNCRQAATDPPGGRVHTSPGSAGGTPALPGLKASRPRSRVCGVTPTLNTYLLARKGVLHRLPASDLLVERLNHRRRCDVQFSGEGLHTQLILTKRQRQLSLAAIAAH